MNVAVQDDLSMIERCADFYKKITQEMAKTIHGQRAVIDQILMTLLCDAHVLLIGVPGLAKTLMVSSLAKVLRLDFKRIQFTPDLLPGDITGSEVIDEDRATGRRDFRFVSGPVFTNLLLADEINRTPPRTQAALLQAMQEREVSMGKETRKLERPFLVMATQNPIEQEGTYPLPEAQLDRFMFNVFVDYPSDEELAQIVLQTTGTAKAEIQPVMDAAEIIKLQDIVRRVPIARPIVDYIVRLSSASRPQHALAPESVRKFVTWGAGPRAAQYLALGAKAYAVLHGDAHASVQGVREVAKSVLRHRILVGFSGQAEGLDSGKIIDTLLAEIPPNKDA